MLLALLIVSFVQGYGSNPYFSNINFSDIELFSEKIKGELTVIVSEKNVEKKALNKEKIVNKAKKYLKKYSLKDTVDLILELEKTNKKEIYKLCLKVKNEKNY